MNESAEVAGNFGTARTIATVTIRPGGAFISQTHFAHSQPLEGAGSWGTGAGAVSGLILRIVPDEDSGEQMGDPTKVFVDVYSTVTAFGTNGPLRVGPVRVNDEEFTAPARRILNLRIGDSVDMHAASSAHAGIATGDNGPLNMHLGFKVSLDGSGIPGTEPLTTFQDDMLEPLQPKAFWRIELE